MKQVKVSNIYLSNNHPLTLIAGLNVLEEKEIIFEVVETCKEVTSKLKIPFIFKASYDKANRSSIHSFRGPGIDEGLELLKKVRSDYAVPVISDIHSIRNTVTMEIPQASTFEKDMARASYKMGRWISNEGSTEGLSEVWLDRFIEPQNINDMNYDDLMALPNLSPVDVTAVLKQKNRGYINGTWELKNSPGISYWGYKNLVDFIRFTDKPVDESGFHVRFNSLVRTVPITSNPDDEGNITAFEDTSMPEQFHKVSITLDKNKKGGVSYHRYMGQPGSI